MDEAIVDKHNTPEYWDNQYAYEIEKGIDQRTDPFLYDQLLNYIKHGDRILDFGCGRCEFLRHALKQKDYIEAYGCDQSKVAIEWAFKKEPRLRLMHDLKEFPTNMIKEPIFDVITIIHSLEHFKDPVDLITVLRGYLKPDGIMIFTMPIEDAEWKEHHRIWNVRDVISDIVGPLTVWSKFIYRPETVIPAGVRGFKEHTLICNDNGQQRKELIAVVKFHD